jgi:hypothetical protein
MGFVIIWPMSVAVRSKACMIFSLSNMGIRGRIQTFPDWVDKEIDAYLLYCSLSNNTKGYGGKTH